DRAAPDWKALLDRPHLFAVDDVPRLELAAVAAGTRVHLHVGADKRRPFDVADLESFDVFAEILVWNVEHPGVRRVRRRLPILCAWRRRAQLANHLAGLRRFLRHRLGP